MTFYYGVDLPNNPGNDWNNVIKDKVASDHLQDPRWTYYPLEDDATLEAVYYQDGAVHLIPPRPTTPAKAIWYWYVPYGWYTYYIEPPNLRADPVAMRIHAHIAKVDEVIADSLLYFQAVRWGDLDTRDYVEAKLRDRFKD
jgi:hypothetical protein